VELAEVPAAGDGETAIVTATPQFSRDSLALFCDEYEITMAQSFWLHRQNERACFELTVRHLPPHRGFLVVAGLEQALAFLAKLRFSADDLAYLASTERFDPGFIATLGWLRFTGDVRAIPEGTIVGAETPLLQIIAPRIEATLVESALLSIINHQTTIATKASRVADAARGRPVWDFSLRRVHGPHAALGVARAAYIGGAAGTATVAAGQRFGIPTTGTMAHHYILRFGQAGEQQAFEQFLRDYPGRSVLLIDTFDTLRGVDRAIAASRATGVTLAGVRIDSGPLLELSSAVRHRLDDAGMRDTEIVASGDLDEYRIDALVIAGAPIDSFGVGTMLGTSADAPALGGIYKLVAQEERGEMRPVMKHSIDKANDPGVHQVFRVAYHDVLALDGEALEGRPLLQPVMRDGRRLEPLPSLQASRDRCHTELTAVPAPMRRLSDPVPWQVMRSARLVALRSVLTGESIESVV